MTHPTETPLDLLLKQVTPIPWRKDGFLIYRQQNPGGRKTFIADCHADPGPSQVYANSAYLTHAANCLPQLVKALEYVQEAIKPVSETGRLPEGGEQTGNRLHIWEAEAIIAKALSLAQTIPTKG